MPRPQQSVAAGGERLQKHLAALGLGSRREAEAWIRAGRVEVNGRPAVLGQRVLARDLIKIDGRPVRQRQRSGTAQAIIAHRSPGEDLREELMVRLPRKAGRRFVAVSPLPHGDGGLELLTSHGALGESLQRAVRALQIVFSVRVRGGLDDAQIEGLRQGRLDDGGRVEVLDIEPGGGEGVNRWYRVVTRGASARALRQLFERQGATVSRILRIELGPLKLSRDLGRGAFRMLSAAQIDALLGGAATEDA